MGQFGWLRVINDVLHFLPGGLGRLIAFDAEGRAVWPTEDLRRLLRQEVRAHLLPHCLQCGTGDRQTPDASAALSLDQGMSFYDVLHHQHPPIALLRAVKDFAKRSYDDAGSRLPPEICLVLYYGSIVVTLLRHNQRITRLSDDDLRSGASWAIRQPWVDEKTRQLFVRGLHHLRVGRHGWRK